MKHHILRQAFFSLLFVIFLIVGTLGTARAVVGLNESGGKENARIKESQASPFHPESSLGATRLSSKSKAYKDGELLVKFKKGVSDQKKKDKHGKHHAKLRRQFKHVGVDHVQLEPGITVEDAIAQYKSDPDVEYAEPDYIVHALDAPPPVLPNDSLFGELWGLHNTGQTGGTAGADIKASEGWNITTGSSNVVVAVIDTGIDYNHEDLAANMWVNISEIPGNGVDDDGNGYVDDVHGINAITGTGNAMDDMGHGTHVAGTIGAAGNNGIGVAGMNWNVKIIGCKFLDSNGNGYYSDAIYCLEYVRTLKANGVNIVATNNSYGGGDYSQALYDAMKLQMDDNILFIAAAGNSSSDNDRLAHYPSNYDLPNVIAVAATDKNDDSGSFSSYGRHTVHVGAPGVDIVSLRASGTNFYGDYLHFIPAGDQYAKYYKASGTSMATPHVAGLAALLKAADPGRDWKSIKNLILAGGDDVASMNGRTITGKRINSLGSLTCTNSPVLSPLKYTDQFTAGIPVNLSVLSINCGSSVGPITATTSTGEVITLSDDGLANDLAAGDGIFSATWTPSTTTNGLLIASPLGNVRVPFLTITTSYLSEGSVTLAYDQVLKAAGGLPPYSWTLASGNLPAGLTLDSTTGEISGIPSAMGDFIFTIQVTDAENHSAFKKLSLHVENSFNIIEQRLWSYDGGSNDWAEGVAVDDAGNVYVAGAAFNQKGDYDYLTIKYDPSGGAIWTKSYDGGLNDGVEGIAVDGGGNVAVAGRSFDSTSIWSHILTIKYDTSGNVLWSQTFESGSDARVRVAMDGNGNIYVTQQKSGTEWLTIKYDPSGNLAWSQIYVGSGWIGEENLATDENGNVFLAGACSKTIGNNCYQLVKYDTSGNFQWATQIDNSTPNARAKAIALDRDGNIFVAGSSTMKIDFNGNLIWEKKHEDEKADIALDEYGNVYVTGFYGDSFSGPCSYFTTKYDTFGNELWTKKSSNVFYQFGTGIALDNSGDVYVTGRAHNGSNYDFLAVKYHDASLQITTKQALVSPVGAAFNQALTVKNGNAPFTWSLYGGSLPNGVSLDTATGTISGTPVTAGIYTFTVAVTDSNSNSATRIYTLNVYPPVSITTVSAQPAQLNTLYGGTLTATGGAAPYTWSLVSGNLPGGVALNASGRILGTPAAKGTFQFTVQVTDRNFNTATKLVSMTVYDQLLIAGDLKSGEVGVPYNWSLSATQGLAPYKWSLLYGSLPDGLTLSTSGEISGTPTTKGIFYFTVQVMDGNTLTAMRQLSISIYDPLSITTPGLPDGIAGTAYSETLTGQGGVPPYGWSVISGNFPAGLTLESSTGVISGIPTAAATSNFVVRLTDRYNSYTEKPMMIRIRPDIQPPVTTVFPPEGSYIGSRNVWFSTGKPATTYCTTDGTIPQMTPDYICSNPLFIRRDTTLTFFSVDEFGNAEQPKTQKFWITGGSLYAWGANIYGQLGDGTSGINRLTPVQVSGVDDVLAVAGGNYHAAALRSDGTVWSWGYNGNGQLGDGTALDRSYPAQVSGITDVVALAGGSYYLIALKGDGNIWTWGSNGDGQLGDGTTDEKHTPVQVTGISEVAAVAGGMYHTVALKKDGTVWAWGSNSKGQLGDGTTVSKPVPVQVGGIGDVVAIACGNYYSVALKRDGTVWAWGDNSSGQLGDGTGTDSYIPVQANGLSNIVSIAGGGHSMALKQDGTVWAWGFNLYGQLGDGTTYNRSTPVQMATNGTMYAIGAGSYHSMAYRNDGTVWTWGYNSSGQLGNGTTTRSYSPVQVSGPANIGAAAIRSSQGFAITPSSLSVQTVSLPDGIAGASYNRSLTGLGGYRPYRWILTSGSLPAGLTLDSATGTISGIPSAAGFYSFTVQVTDEKGTTAIKEVGLTITTCTVTPSTGANGAITPSIPQTVNYNQTISFTITPDTGYHIASATGCGGTLSGSTYTTGPVTADCTVTATFAINTYTVTPSVGANGSMNPATPQTLNDNQSASFTIMPDTGYHIVSVTGCGGTLSGSTYTTGSVTADCTVTATFAINTYTVTPSAGANGTISPATPQTLNYNQAASFAITPNTGYRVASVIGCGGTLNGSTYTTGPVTADCTVTAAFAINSYNLSVLKAGTGSGTVTSSPAGISCGSTCSADYNPGTSVALSASPTTGSFFAGWSGACTGTGSCVVAMNAAKSVTATFNQYITVTVPNGGESWSRGGTYVIKWSYGGNPGSNVKIELLKGGVVNRTITSSASIGANGSGSYTWRISSGQATGSDCQIRITSTSNGNYKDTSNGNFTIQ